MLSNIDIEIVEEQALSLQRGLEDLQKRLVGEDRHEDNYNHLGTLDANLKCLRRTIDRVVNELDY